METIEININDAIKREESTLNLMKNEEHISNEQNIITLGKK